jgi:thiosulfate/3-mercaptopyruvate sulfurtransferase
MPSPLVSPADAWASLQSGDALAIDCRFDLADTAKGERDYAAGHVPGAVHAHLDRDLADLGVRGRGRHPLPTDEAFSRTLSRWGITPAMRVIAYDDGREARAPRLWWMLRIVGHPRVQVIDGGWTAWLAAGLPVETRAPERTPTSYPARFDRGAIASSDDVARGLADGSLALLDARAASRFRGENETLDPVAGHVPGAINRPFADNLQADARFKDPAVLRREFESLTAGRTPREVALMCGSGVTACHNLLAMEHAGLPGARVYAGSWSEWISSPARPVATGPA